MMGWLISAGEILLDDARQRINHPDVSYFTLESTLCCYKGWFKKNRRYPNCYVDMLYNRIKKAEEKWEGKEDFSDFWEARKKYLTSDLLLEYNPMDVGLKPAKQNHFRETGQVIMMQNEWSCFNNDYNDQIDSKGLELFT